MDKYSRQFTANLRNPAALARFLLLLPKVVRLVFRLLRDARVPATTKLILLGGFLYFVSPIDLIPDLLVPVLGFGDDLAVLILSFRAFLKRCPPDVLNEHVQALQKKS